MDIIFMGTPEFAVPTLEMLINEGYNVKAVVTQPDRPKGRGKKLTPPPIKELALKNNIPVIQPERIKGDLKFQKQIEKINPDLMVVVAFGQILPKEILDIPRLGSINIHGSILPKYRGSSPIQYAVLKGDEETGVTLMYMDEGMDTGDIITIKKMPLSADETSGSLHDKMMHVGAEALKEALPGIKAGTYKAEIQDESKSTYAPRLDKQMGLIDWGKTSFEIDCLVRGLNPWPSAYTYYEGELLKIWQVEEIDQEEYNDKYKDLKGKPGQIIDIIEDRGILIKTLDTALLVKEIQGPGRKRMKSTDFMRGYEIKKDKFFGIR